METIATGSGEGASGDACARIRGHLARGAPWDACDAFRTALAVHAANPEFLYCGALAHARSGARHEAHALLDRAQAAAAQAPALLSEILSLRGRLWKDLLHRDADAPDAATFAARARGEYLAAWSLQHDPYPGINAATLSLLHGDLAAAREIAQDIGARLATPATLWDRATAGEAALLLGEVELARQHYAAARELAAEDVGSVATMRRQLRLLSRVMPEAADVLALLPEPSVLAFAGHMIDAPGRPVPRFPAALEPAVRAAIREHLASAPQSVVYTSAACGADLVCIEAALELGAEVNVVLPFARDDFVRTSVAVGGAGWVPRFERALDGATRVIAATAESHLGDDVLFDHAARLVEGLALLRAAQLETSPTLLCVMDVEAPSRVGGTVASFERWRRCVGAPTVIDLRELRARVDGPAAAAAAKRAAAAPGAAPAAAEHPPDPHPAPEAPLDATRPQRTLKTLLFADFAGYSRLHDAQAPLFQGRFWQIAADQIAASPVAPLLANTWGDALYVVFEAPDDGAEFALGLLARMRAVDWTAAGLADDSQIRIALHAGPVFRGFDPIMARDNYFGASVTRAARIEPVTPPGMVYASEAFAATLAAGGQAGYALEYVGALALAKGYGESRIYRLDRR